MKEKLTIGRQSKIKEYLKIPGLWLINSLGAVRILQDNIIYCYHKKGVTRVYFSCGRIAKVYIPLKRLEQRLCSKRFYRCHRNYLINLDHTGAGLLENDVFRSPGYGPVSVSRRRKNHLIMVMEGMTSNRGISA